MIEYLLSLSLLIVVVLLIRGIFRKTVSPRAIYALWLVVVVRMLLPITLFEVDVTLPEFLQTHHTEHSEQSEQLPEDSGASADVQEQSTVSTPMQTAPTIPSHSTSPTTPEYPTVITPITPTTPVTPTVPADTTPVTPSTPATDPEEVIALEEPASINWNRIADIVWFCGVVIATVWVLLTSITYSRRLKKDRVFHRTVRGTKVYVSEYAGVPCIAGLIPSIYITPEASNSKSEILIIIHEHVHLRHGDHIWSIIRALALIVFWWNPLVWAAATVSKQDAELACDDAISSKMNEDGRLKYANILLDTIPQKHRYAVGFGSAPMKERILMLTKKQKNRWLSLIIAIVLAVSAVGCSFVSLNEKPGEELSNDKIGLVTENLSDFLTEEQITLYEKAGLIYPLFNGVSDSINILHLLLEGASFEEQKTYRVTYNTGDEGVYRIDSFTYLPSYGVYDTLDEFKALCLSVFTEEYFEDLNQSSTYSGSSFDLFTDYNSQLYYVDAAKGGAFGYAPDEFPDEYELVEMSDEVIVFNVTGHYKSSNVNPNFTLTEETFTVRMVLTQNGWRFSKFADAGLDEPPPTKDPEDSAPNEAIEYTKKLAKYFRDPVESVTELREHQSLWEFLVNSIYELHENEIVTLSDVTEKDYYPQYHIPYNYMNKAAELLLGIENGLPEKLMSEDYHWLKDQDAFLYSPFSPPMYMTECIHSEMDVDGTIYVTIKISRIEEKEALAVNTYALKPVDDPDFGKLYQLLSITGETFSPLMKDHSERISLYCTAEESSGWAKHFRLTLGEHETYISPEIGALTSIEWAPQLYCMDIAVPTLPADGIDDAVIILTTGAGTGVHTEEAYVLSGADGTLYSFIEPYILIENLVEYDKNGAAWIIDASGNRIDLPDNAYFNQNYKFYIEDGCLYAEVPIGYGILQYTGDYFVIRYRAGNVTWEWEDMSFAIRQTLPHQAIMENQSVLYDTLTGKEMLLTDWLKNAGYAVSKYTVIDLDKDAYSETVLWLTRGSDEYAGFLILHSNGGKTNAHLLYYRQFSNLKEDGTFDFSGGVANGGFGEISFNGDSYTIQKLAYRESADNQNVFYFVEDKSVSRDVFDAFVNEQNQKSDAMWYEWNAGQEDQFTPEMNLDSIDGQWYHSFRYESWYAFYGLNFRNQTAEMQFDHGLYESEYDNRYSGTYTVDPATQEIMAVLHDNSNMHNDPNITLRFTIEVQTDQNDKTLVLHILSCDVPKYQHLVGQSLAFTREFGYADLQYQDTQDYYQMWYDHQLTAEELLGKGAVITNIVEKIKTTTGIDLYATHFIYEYHSEEDRFPFRFLITDETGTKIIEANIIRYKDKTDGIEKYAVEVNPVVITVE